MRFAETTQEVQIARPKVPQTPTANFRLDFGLTPGRRQLNHIFRHRQEQKQLITQQIAQMEENRNGLAEESPSESMASSGRPFGFDEMEGFRNIDVNKVLFIINAFRKKLSFLD
jgi:hypothetical protein